MQYTVYSPHLSNLYIVLHIVCSTPLLFVHCAFYRFLASTLYTVNSALDICHHSTMYTVVYIIWKCSTISTLLHYVCCAVHYLLDTAPPCSLCCTFYDPKWLHNIHYCMLYTSHFFIVHTVIYDIWLSFGLALNFIVADNGLRGM